MSNRLFVFAMLALGLTTLSGCASDTANKPPEKERVSTTAWNKPASWEGQGSLGGMGLGGSGSNR